MLFLALDTSGDTCSLAITRGAECLVEVNFAHQRQLTERLPGIVEFALSQAGVRLEELDAFAVGLGPGSFTGVRVGVTMAKVWAETLGKRLIGVSSLDVLSRAASGTGVNVVTVAPSRKDEVIAAFYRPERANPIFDPKVMPTAEVVERAREAFGEAQVLVLGECAHWVPTGALVQIRSVSPRAYWVSRLGNARLRVLGPDDPATLAPLYIAPPPIRGQG